MSLWLRLGGLLTCAGAVSGRADPTFDTENPLSFFTNVASRLVADELNLNLLHLPVAPTNQYTPAVERLVQVTANIYEAMSTNAFPRVYRPLFSADAAGNVFLTGYQQVTGVTGISDPQLTAPVDVGAVASLYGPGTNLAVNVYGVPWVIGVRKGFPNFNQFSFVTQAQFTRKLQFTRSGLTSAATFATNECYVLGVSNSFGVSFWNSYSNAYPDPVQIFAEVSVNQTLTTDSAAFGGQTASFSLWQRVTNWPGSAWNSQQPPGVRVPATGSFVSSNWNYSFFAPNYSFWPSGDIFVIGTNAFDPGPLKPLPTLQLTTSNWVYALMLDGPNVIDFVEIPVPVNSTNLSTALADVYPSPSGTMPADDYIWATNRVPNGGLEGIRQQWGISAGLVISPNPAFWNPPAGFPTGSIADMQQFFAEFFNGSSANGYLTIEAPYVPTRTVYCPYQLQANDPLLHYMVSDLGGSPGVVSQWYNQINVNDLWLQNDLAPNTLPSVSYSSTTGRFQPWSRNLLMRFLPYVDTNACSFLFKDPWIVGSDSWTFPTNQTWNLNWLGQIHRGTPWQTIYLKSEDVLAESSTNSAGNALGTNTWMAWTGDTNPADAVLMRPVADWRLVDLLGNILNTNNPAALFSVNSANPGAWAALVDGMGVTSNSLPDSAIYRNLIIPPAFASYTISSNSTQAGIIAGAIRSVQAMQAGGAFAAIGDILAVPQLSSRSPYLNWNDSYQQIYGMTDAAYEAVPSQLLPLLRMDSVGAVTNGGNGQLSLRFTGYDGHGYAVQVSGDLVNWSGVTTNTPVNGVFTVPISLSSPPGGQFFRSVLVW